MEQYERDHLALVTDNAAECTVLLRSNGAFPLEKPGKIAAFGSGLRYTVKGGTGSGEVNSRFQYTIEQSLEREGFEITTKSWLDAYDRVRRRVRKAFLQELKAEAKRKHENVYMYAMGKAMKEPDHELSLEKTGDTAIYVLSRNSGEGSDREAAEGDVKLSASELRDISALQNMYERFMLVLNVGGVVDLSPLEEVGNILLLSQLGADSGKVLADILTGRQNPSGKLTTTWAAWEEYSSEGTFGDWNETRYNEGIYVGYRYFDTFRKKALFPFGYGLSYTSFASRVCSVGTSADAVTLRIRVKNTGTRAGKEVIQSYVSLPWGKLDKAYQELAGYAKTSLLAPGAEEELVICFALSGFASYDEERAAYILEAGDYIIRVGNSSASTEIAAVITLDETAVVFRTRNCLGAPDFVDIRPERERPAGRCVGADAVPPAGKMEVLRLSLRAEDIKTAEAVYDAPYEIDERVKAFSEEELAYLQIGGFDPDAKGLSIVGNAAFHVAGAAGETTSQLAEKGIAPLVMADGPAGVRVAKRYYEDEKGARDASGGGMIPESMLDLMNPVVKFIVKKLIGSSRPPKNAVIKEHAATMIPIGTAIAQSFNTELARAFGDLVGCEMERMGVHLWLAPALNIHRSILCGRNFEYYSEDPLVSGLTAAAVAAGVQAHKGRGAVIKHYAANNAETNRYCNNSQVSERAMREIYLRGFGICIRKSQPEAVMTSYNLLNGTHTSEHKGLIGDILRSEFGFEGIVMTDWVIAMMTGAASVHRNALSDRVAAAGGDLFMPGSRRDYKNVMQALKDGGLTRKQLEINVTRVLRVVDRLAR